jgi:hypothetical protein
MPQSARYVQLDRRLRKLRAHLLPKVWSPTGDYTPRVLDHARSYRLLTHAEFEHFIEERCLSIARSRIERFTAAGGHSTTVMSLLARCGGIRPNEKRPASLSDCAKRAYAIYKGIVDGNNGIKEENLIKLLSPIGIDEADLTDTTWLAAVNSFGRNRGQLAHKSVGARDLIDPLTEFNDVQHIQAGFANLDNTLRNLD